MENSTHTILLYDDLPWATVKLNYTPGFDTVYRWVHQSDSYCDAIKYRLHSQKFQVIQENGVMHKPQIENGYYLTIMHSDNSSQCDDPDIKYGPVPEEFIKNLSKINEKVKPEIKIDSEMVFNGSKYYVVCYNEIIGNPPFYRLSAYLTYKNRNLVFRFQDNTMPYEEFEETTMRILRNISLE